MQILLFGLLSGIASGLLFDFDSAFIPGVLFAVAVLIASRARFEKVGPMRMLAFMAASVLANYVAVQAAIWTSDAGLAGLEKDLAIGAAGGLVGSIILSIAIALVFRQRFWRTLPVLACAGTLAGVPFMLLPHAVVSYALWQTAVAAAIGWLWSRRGEPR